MFWYPFLPHGHAWSRLRIDLSNWHFRKSSRMGRTRRLQEWRQSNDSPEFVLDLYSNCKVVYLDLASNELSGPSVRTDASFSVICSSRGDARLLTVDPI
jgi:hypothetical protein